MLRKPQVLVFHRVLMVLLYQKPPPLEDQKNHFRRMCCQRELSAKNSIRPERQEHNNRLLPIPVPHRNMRIQPEQNEHNNPQLKKRPEQPVSGLMEQLEISNLRWIK